MNREGWVRMPPPTAATANCQWWQNHEKMLAVAVAVEANRWHLSISSPPGKRPPPTWEEIRDARYEFLPDDIYACMILPPKKEYVNVHPNTFHLWEVPELWGKRIITLR